MCVYVCTICCNFKLLADTLHTQGRRKHFRIGQAIKFRKRHFGSPKDLQEGHMRSHVGQVWCTRLNSRSDLIRSAILWVT